MYERGEREPDIKTLEKIADFFSVDVDYLIGRSKEKPASVPEHHEPTYTEVQSLLTRSGKKFTVEQKQDLIRTLLS